MAVDGWPRPGVTQRSGSTETVITCTGDLGDPSFQRRFRSVLKELRGIVCKGSDERLRVRKMEPWNSVRVTFSIGVEAAERLRALAEAGGEVLARLGILSVQLPNGQVISVRVSAPSTPPNVIAPSVSSLPPLVPATVAAGGSSQPQAGTAPVAARFPFTSMTQASAIVSRETKACAAPSPGHYPPPPYPEGRAEPPQASPLLVNLLQTDQVVGGASTPGTAGRPTAYARPAGSSAGYQSSGAAFPTAAPPPPPYTRPALTSPTALTSPPPPVPPAAQQRIQSTPTGAVHHLHHPAAIHQIQKDSPVVAAGSSGSAVGPSPTPSAVPPGHQPPAQHQGKTVQYLINPLTGVLEPAISSESESETDPPDPVKRDADSPPPPQPLTALPEPPPPARAPVLPATPLTPLIPVVALQRHPIPVNSQPQLPVPLPVKLAEPEDETRVKKPLAEDAVPAVPLVPLVGAAIPREPETAEEERPKCEEKIKLRLKLDKTTESSFNQYKTTESSSMTSSSVSTSVSGGSTPLTGSSEPRVPPLHISLRGRPAVVSRKEKRPRKEESSGESRSERQEREREPLSQGTYEGTCQFPSEEEVASILRSMPTGGKLLNTTVTARRKRDKKKIYPRSVPRVEEKLKKGSSSLLKSVVKSAAKEVRMMTAQRSSKPLQNKKPASPVLNNQSPVVSSKPPVAELEATSNGNAVVVVGGGKFKEAVAAASNGSSSSSISSSGSAGSTGDDSGIESMDALSEKSPNQSTSPLRKEELPKKKEKEVEEVVPIRLTPALYTYSNPERQREETPSPDHTEEERFGGKSLLEQLLIDIPNGDSAERRPNPLRRSPEISPTLPTSGKRGRRPSESSSSDPPTPRPNKRKCSENASELIKACMDDGKRDVVPLSQGDAAYSSDDEAKRKEEEEARSRLSEDKPSIRTTFNTRRSARQSEIREQRPTRKTASQTKKEEVVVVGSKRRRNSKEK